MHNTQSIKKTTLASYAVIKTLTDSNDYHNSYEILADFIRYIVVDRKWHKFSIMELSNELQIEFGFDNIPIPAIRTSLRQIKEIKKSGDDYVLPIGTSFETDIFQRVNEKSIVQSQSIIDRLYEFANEQSSEVIIREPLEGAFIKYILDDAATIDKKYADIISKFIIKNEHDEEFRNQITQIREGSILYCGLAYNISELGSIKSDLTLYLDTEVLFNIAGYNGVLYQKMALDLLTQVKIANKKQKKIKLRFFKEVETELKNFFISAENIILGKEAYFNNAMKSIVNGCDTISDVRIKEADFFNNLRIQHGIIPDERESYYTKEDYQYNLEVVPNGFPDDRKSLEAVRYISHINKLRRGNNSDDYIKCKYLLVTETRRIQEISNAIQTNKDKCGFVLPTSTITNILWFKLGSGFSKSEYPTNTDISFKARRIISGEIANNVVHLYEDTKRQYSAGIIDKNQVANRIILMHEKTLAPDEVVADNIDNLLDFSPEYIAKYEQGIQQNIVQLEEQQAIIDKLEFDNSTVKGKNESLVNELNKVTKELDISVSQLGEKDETIKQQAEELKEYREKDNKTKKKKERIKSKAIFCAGIIIKAIIFSILIVIVNYFTGKMSANSKDAINNITSAVSLVLYGVSVYKDDWKKYKMNSEKISNNKENPS